MLYEGYWKNGQKEGKGRIINREGSVFEGFMSGGQTVGKGLYTYLNGEKKHVNSWNNLHSSQSTYRLTGTGQRPKIKANYGIRSRSEANVREKLN